MPELFSRMDNLNWLTPSIADILDQGSTPPGGDGSIRERMLTIQHELEELETPARIVNVRSTPSYTLYIARPESVGRMENRRLVTANEIKKSIKQIADNHKDWLLGYIPQLREDDAAVGILLRTTDHRPMSLRRLLVRSTFRNEASTFAFVVGITLEQQIILDNLVEIGHLLIIGGDNAKQHLIRSTLLTLIMLNTPAEVRVALTGQSSDAYKYLVGAPHALGRILTEPAEGRRLIDGLVKEIQRRQQSFKDENVANVDEYNASIQEQSKAKLPRIILVVDALSDEHWQTEHKNWADSITHLLMNGKQAGIHLILTSEEEEKVDLPTRALNEIPVKIITRAYSKELSSEIPDFHASLLRFVDAFVIDKTEKNNITPVELCAISNTEIKNVVDYWRQMSKQRYQEMQMIQSSNKTGVTSVLTPPSRPLEREAQLPTPPTPPKPSHATLERATQVLETQVLESQKNSPTGKVLQTVATVTAIEEVELEEEIIVENTPLQELPEEIETIEAQSIRPPVIKQAIALASYLGWLSVGALHDIFGISLEEADEIITQLRTENIIEDVESPTYRLVRLVQLNGKYPTD